MASYAPEQPTLEELEALYELDAETLVEVDAARAEMSGILSLEQPGLVAIIGPCAMTGAVETIDAEGDQLYELTQSTAGLYAAHRMPPWKPRTNSADWFGEETTNPEGAYRTIARRADKAANVAIEIGHIPHLTRYGDRLTLGWSGGRNIEDGELIEALASHDQSLPVGVKNGLDGDPRRALEHVARINDLRDEDAAPAVLIYRGGKNAQDPQAWEREYRAALEATGGRMIVDTAHGGEMAHHREGAYAKSDIGQVACMEHVIAIAARNSEMPAGIMMESSDAHSPTDPLIPFEVAIDGLLRLHELRINRITTPV